MTKDELRVEQRRLAHEANVKEAMQIIVDEWILSERDLRNHPALSGHSGIVIQEAWRRLYGLDGHDAIVERLRRLPMTQYEIAQAIGVSQRFIGMVLQGAQRLPPKRMRQAKEIITSIFRSDPLYRFGMVVKEKQKTT